MFANSLKQNHSADQRVGRRRRGGEVNPVEVQFRVFVG